MGSFRKLLLMISELLLMLLQVRLLIEAVTDEKEFNLNISKFHQSDYHVEFGRIELARYNKDYFKDDISVITRKYNRSQPIVNATFTFKRCLGNDLSVTVQAYTFLSNEYRYFPLRFAVNGCKALAANMVGTRRLLECGNFTGCPLKNHTYHVCNFYPDGSKFPPFVPNGNYKVELQFNYFSTEIAVANLYIVLSRPIVKK